MVTQTGAEASTVSVSPQRSVARHSVGAAPASTASPPPAPAASPAPPGSREINDRVLPINAHGGTYAPAAGPNAPSPSAGTPPSLGDIRPPQPPQFSGLYDGRPPTRVRRGTEPNQEFHQEFLGHRPRGGKSVDVLPSQVRPQLPAQQQTQQDQAKAQAQAQRERSSSVRNRRSAKLRRGSKMTRGSFESDGDGFDDDEKERRGSGSLRNVFRKMFGSNKVRRDDVVLPRRPVTRGQEGQTRGYWAETDRKLVLRDGTIHKVDQLGRRHDPIMDMHVHEIMPSTPLGSHLPFPMNVNAPQDSPPRQDLQQDLSRPFSSPESPSKGLGRRATLPSLVISQSDLAALATMWNSDDGDSPAGALRRNTPTPDIGMAITSTAKLNSNRRSRSADALADLAREQARLEEQLTAQERGHTREAEIAYWRASYAPAAIEMRDFDEEQQRSLLRTADEVAQDAKPPPAGDDQIKSVQQSLPQARPRPSLDQPPAARSPEHTTTQSLTSGEDGPASPRGHARNFSRPGTSERVSIDQNTVADRLWRLEQTVKSLQGITDRSNATPDSINLKPQGSDAPARYGSQRSNMPPGHDTTRHGEAPTRQEDSQEQMRGYSPQTPKLPPGTAAYTWSQNEVMSDTKEQASTSSRGPQTFYNPTGAPPSGANDLDTAPRPQTSHAVASSLPSPNIYDHLAPLYAALRYERSKRKDAETRMTQFQQDISELKQIVEALQRNQHDQQQLYQQLQQQLQHQQEYQQQQHQQPYQIATPFTSRSEGSTYGRSMRRVGHLHQPQHAQAHQYQHHGYPVGPTGYPTPSPEDRFAANPSSGSNFSSEDDAAHAPMTHPQQSRFSGLDNDTESSEYDESDDVNLDSDRDRSRNRDRNRNTVVPGHYGHHHQHFQEAFGGPYDDTDGEGDGSADGEREVFGTPSEGLEGSSFPPRPGAGELRSLLPTAPLSSSPAPQAVPVTAPAPVPAQTQTQTQGSKIPTPKQSMKNLRPSTAGAAFASGNVKVVGGKASQTGLGGGNGWAIGSGSTNSLKNRFGFPGGKS